MDMLPTVLYRDNEIIEELPGSKVENITERMTDEGTQFIASHRKRPFFLYFSHTLSHPPIKDAPRRQLGSAGYLLHLVVEMVAGNNACGSAPDSCHIVPYRRS
jgi:hypothetical protein